MSSAIRAIYIYEFFILPGATYRSDVSKQGLESVLKKLAISHLRRRSVCLRVRLHLPLFMSRGFVFVRGREQEGLTVQGGRGASAAEEE